MKLWEIADTESITILGFGREGQSTYKFLRQRYPTKSLVIADRTPLNELPLTAELRITLNADKHLVDKTGSGYLASICEALVIFKSPGIPNSLPEIAKAVQAGHRVTSQTQVLFDNYSREKIIGITGTKGKSTTSSLIWSILSSSGLRAALVGNIGVPPIAELNRDADVLVCELSSFQLNDLERSPHISVLLDIVPEHLDYHASFEEYFAAKANITRFQTAADYLIYGSDHHLPGLIAAQSKARRILFGQGANIQEGCVLRESDIVWCSAGREEIVLSRNDVPLLGRFNLLNVMASICVSKVLGISAADIQLAVRNFKPLKHRLQFIGRFRGIDFYDDSISTVPASTLGAIEALGKRVSVLIAGGYDRNLQFDDFARELASCSVNALVLFPTTGERIWRAIENHRGLYSSLPEVRFVSNMREAVEKAFELAQPGTVCLLSPASPSFGIFRDFEDRGDKFAQEVARLGSA